MSTSEYHHSPRGPSFLLDCYLENCLDCRHRYPQHLQRHNPGSDRNSSNNSNIVNNSNHHGVAHHLPADATGMATGNPDSRSSSSLRRVGDLDSSLSLTLSTRCSFCASSISMAHMLSKSHGSHSNDKFGNYVPDFDDCINCRLGGKSIEVVKSVEMSYMREPEPPGCMAGLTKPFKSFFKFIFALLSCAFSKRKSGKRAKVTKRSATRNQLPLPVSGGAITDAPSRSRSTGLVLAGQVVPSSTRHLGVEENSVLAERRQRDAASSLNDHPEGVRRVGGARLQCRGRRRLNLCRSTCSSAMIVQRFALRDLNVAPLHSTSLDTSLSSTEPEMPPFHATRVTSFTSSGRIASSSTTSLSSHCIASRSTPYSSLTRSMSLRHERGHPKATAIGESLAGPREEHWSHVGLDRRASVPSPYWRCPRRDNGMFKGSDESLDDHGDRRFQNSESQELTSSTGSFVSLSDAVSNSFQASRSWQEDDVDLDLLGLSGACSLPKKARTGLADPTTDSPLLEKSPAQFPSRLTESRRRCKSLSMSSRPRHAKSTVTLALPGPPSPWLTPTPIVLTPTPNVLTPTPNVLTPIPFVPGSGARPKELVAKPTKERRGSFHGTCWDASTTSSSFFRPRSSTDPFLRQAVDVDVDRRRCSKSDCLPPYDFSRFSFNDHCTQPSFESEGPVHCRCQLDRGAGMDGLSAIQGRLESGASGSAQSSRPFVSSSLAFDKFRRRRASSDVDSFSVDYGLRSDAPKKEQCQVLDFVAHQVFSDAKSGISSSSSASSSTLKGDDEDNLASVVSGDEDNLASVVSGDEDNLAIVVSGDEDNLAIVVSGDEDNLASVVSTDVDNLASDVSSDEWCRRSSQNEQQRYHHQSQHPQQQHHQHIQHDHHQYHLQQHQYHQQHQHQHEHQQHQHHHQLRHQHHHQHHHWHHHQLQQPMPDCVPDAPFTRRPRTLDVVSVMETRHDFTQRGQLDDYVIVDFEAPPPRCQRRGHGVKDTPCRKDLGVAQCPGSACCPVARQPTGEVPRRRKEQAMLTDARRDAWVVLDAEGKEETHTSHSDSLPPVGGYTSALTRPAEGQSLINYLTSQDFNTCANMEKENAHFHISEVLISTFESMSWDKMIKKSGSDRSSSSSDEEIQELRQRIRIRKRERMLEKNRLFPSVSDAPTESSGQRTSPLNLSMSESSASEGEGEEQGSMDLTMSSDAHDNLQTLKSSGLNLSMASLYSDAELSRRNQQIQRISSSQEENRPPGSAEQVAISLLKKFSEKHLPKASELKWLVSEVDAPQQLLPLPSSIPISPDDGEVQAKQSQQTRLRGNLEWAPPRPQIIFSIHPPEKRAVVLARQNFRCAGCGTRVDPAFIKRYRYCEYLGKYFCQCCHAGDTSIIPGRVIERWDFSPYPVSNFSFTLLEKMWAEPLFHVDSINPALYRRVRSLEPIKQGRQQIHHLRSLFEVCRRDDKLVTQLQKLPHHWVNNDNAFSMEDFNSVKNGPMLQTINAFVVSAYAHVSHCQLCQGLGFICGLCNDRRTIFPFQLNVVARCPVCHACYHKKCFVPDKCPKCLRIASRRKQLAEADPLTSPSSESADSQEGVMQ